MFLRQSGRDSRKMSNNKFFCTESELYRQFPTELRPMIAWWLRSSELPVSPDLISKWSPQELVKYSFQELDEELKQAVVDFCQGKEITLGDRTRLEFRGFWKRGLNEPGCVWNYLSDYLFAHPLG